MIKDLEMGDYPALNRSAQCNNKGPISERESQKHRVSERFADATLMVLKIKEEATGQGIQATTGSWKR